MAPDRRWLLMTIAHMKIARITLTKLEIMNEGPIGICTSQWAIAHWLEGNSIP
jgi:hypothetical protein